MPKPPASRGVTNARIVQVALRNQHQWPRQRGCQRLDFVGQLLQEVNRRAIDERMHRIQPQSVDVKIAQPHQRVVAEEPPHFVAPAPSRFTAPPHGVWCVSVRYGPNLPV